MSDSAPPHRQGLETCYGRSLPLTSPTGHRGPLGRRQAGLSIVEFTLIVPVLLLFLFAFLEFGWLLDSYVTVVNATNTGARYFAGQANSATANADTLIYVRNALPNRLRASLTIVTAVNGAACTDASNPTCGDALNTVSNSGTAGQATVAVTWAITPPAALRIPVFGLDTLWPASFTFTVAERVSASF